MDQMFELVEAYAVDMFPHTEHIELVSLFKRKQVANPNKKAKLE